MAGDILTDGPSASMNGPLQPGPQSSLYGSPADNWAIPHSNAAPAAMPTTDPLLRVNSAVSSQLPPKIVGS